MQMSDDHDDVIKWNISALLTICAGNSPVIGEFPAQRAVMRNFDVFFDLRLNKRLSTRSWGWLFETPSHPLWCDCNVPYTNMKKSEKCTYYSVPLPSAKFFSSHIGIETMFNAMPRHIAYIQDYVILRRCALVSLLQLTWIFISKIGFTILNANYLAK